MVILGAGAAGVGIGRLLRHALAADGVSGDGLVQAVACLDSRGVVIDDGSIRDTYKRELAWPTALADATGLGPGKPRDLAAAVSALRPTVLIGTSGEPDTFPESVIREMARHTERPIVLPLSNPTSQCEARPEHVLRWTNGRALVATGSPFAPVRFGERTFVIGQANNAFVFPGIGLGAMVAEARKVTDGMLMAAARALADAVRDDPPEGGSLFPAVPKLRSVTVRVAAAVVAAARDDGVGRPLGDQEIAGVVRDAMWEPRYPDLVPA